MHRHRVHCTPSRRGRRRTPADPESLTVQERKAAGHWAGGGVKETEVTFAEKFGPTEEKSLGIVCFSTKTGERSFK